MTEKHPEPLGAVQPPQAADPEATNHNDQNGDSMPKKSETPPNEDADESPEANDAFELTDQYDRFDYVANGGIVVVHEFTFSDGSGMKAWTDDDGETYLTRQIDRRGRASLASTKTGLSAADVNALLASLDPKGR